MKRTILFVLLLCLLVNTKAQEMSDSVALGEVIVDAAKVIETADGKRYFPTLVQKEHSTDGYSLLQKLSLPLLIIDPVQHTITPPPMYGEVQIRINDAVANREDLMALDVRAVERVDYIEHPGVRYGSDVGFVINIVTHRAVAGYEVGAEATMSSTRWMADGNSFVRWNQGHSEWQLLASADLKEFRHNSVSEQARYQMSDGTMLEVTREDMPESRRQHHTNEQFAARYSFVEPERCIFQASFSTQFAQLPQYKAKICQTTGLSVIPSDVSLSQTNRSFVPMLDLYTQLHIAPHQILTANIVGTTIRSHYTYDYQSLFSFSYKSKGQTYSLQSEAIYENQLKPFTLSLGVNWLQKYVENRYTGDAEALNAVQQSNLRLFAQMKGRLGQLSYVAGVELRRDYYRQSETRQDDVTLRPKLSLNLPIGNIFRLSYNGSCMERPPRLDYRSGVVTRENEWEAMAGNPQLRSEQWWEHRVALSLQMPRLFAETGLMFRDIYHPYMTSTQRISSSLGGGTGDVFLTMRKNQRSIRMLGWQNQAQWHAVPERLEFSGGINLYRFLNRGNDYFHALTFCNLSLSATAYLGRFTLTAYFDNGWHFVENEQEGRNDGAFYIGGDYDLGSFTIGLYWQHPFRRRVCFNDATLLNRDVWKRTMMTSRDTASLLNLTVSWRFSQGRRYSSPKKQITLNDNDSGIVKQTQ